MASRKIIIAALCLAFLGVAAAKIPAGVEESYDTGNDLESSARKLTAYAGCDATKNVCTVDNGNGTSTTCVNDIDGYHHCVTHANGETAGGRKLLATHTEVERKAAANMRSLSVYTGCSATGNVCTVDNGNGTSTVCINDIGGYHRCFTYDNGSNSGKKLLRK